MSSLENFVVLLFPMSDSRKTTDETRQTKSTGYVVGAAALAALVLGLTVFLFVRGFQWRNALAELRAEPGIEILSVERVGFLKKRLLGLRDPLAPLPETFLRKHNIGPLSAEVILTEYHSLNTKYAAEREKQRRSTIEDMREVMVAAVADFSNTMDAKREEDLERITKMLFEARFPDAMESVDIEWKDDHWLVKGELYAPAHEKFVSNAPDYVVEGELDFTQLINLTESKTAALQAEIESTNLFSSDLDGEFVHIERVIRLVSTYDEVCRISGIPRPRLQLNAVGFSTNLIKKVKQHLTKADHMSPNRFLPDRSDQADGQERAFASLKIVPSPKP